MTKLGSVDMKDVPVDVMDEMSSADEYSKEDSDHSSTERGP